MTRIKLASIAIHIAAWFAITFYGGYDFIGWATLSACLLFSGGTTHIGISQARRRRSSLLGTISMAISALFLTAYVVKLGLAPFLADQYWVVPELIDGQTLMAGLPQAMVVATVGYIMVQIAVLMFPLRMPWSWAIDRERNRLFTLVWLTPVALLIKYLLKQNFDLGVPGIEPAYLGVPYLSGFLALVIDDGLIFLANLVLFFALTKGRPHLLPLGFAYAFGNAAVDLSFGSKDTLMYELVICTLYIFIARKSVSAPPAKLARTRRIAFVTIGVLGVLSIVIYKFINFYRFALLAGVSSPGRAIAVALSNSTANERSSLVQILNRVTGIEVLTAVQNKLQQFAGQFSLISLFDGSVLPYFTTLIFGTNDVATRFSLTQFGYFQIAAGIPGVLLGSFAVGIMFCIVQYLLLRMPVSRNMKTAFMPILWILFIKLLLGGSGLFLWLKGIGAVLACFFLFASLAVSRSRHKRTPHKVRLTLHRQPG